MKKRMLLAPAVAVAITGLGAAPALAATTPASTPTATATATAPAADPAITFVGDVSNLNVGHLYTGDIDTSWSISGLAPETFYTVEFSSTAPGVQADPSSAVVSGSIFTDETGAEADNTFSIYPDRDSINDWAGDYTISVVDEAGTTVVSRTLTVDAIAYNPQLGISPQTATVAELEAEGGSDLNARGLEPFAEYTVRATMEGDDSRSSKWPEYADAYGRIASGIVAENPATAENLVGTWNIDLVNAAGDVVASSDLIVSQVAPTLSVNTDQISVEDFNSGAENFVFSTTADSDPLIADNDGYHLIVSGPEGFETLDLAASSNAEGALNPVTWAADGTEVPEGEYTVALQDGAGNGLATTTVTVGDPAPEETPSEEPTTEAPSEEPTTEAPSEEPTTEAPSDDETTEAPAPQPSEESTEEANAGGSEDTTDEESTEDESDPSALPRTGAELSALGAGAVLLAVGGAAVFLTRRRVK